MLEVEGVAKAYKGGKYGVRGLSLAAAPGVLGRLAGLVPFLDVKGPEMNRSETVTLFNELCFLAPARLAEPSVRWESVAARPAPARPRSCR